MTEHYSTYSDDGLQGTASAFPVSAPRILRLPEVMARVGLCRASIYQHINEGSFPKQITLGPRAVGWLEHEINTWLWSRISARRRQEL